MGTWGTAIFSDDFALDIKSEFKDKIGFGKSPSEATDELIVDHRDSLNDQDDESIFWLALAAIQWEMGRLQDNVKQRAIEIIENGQDLKRWTDDEKQLNQRKNVLEKLEAKLNSKQPMPRKVGTPFVLQTKMEVGDLLLYSHPSGNKAIIKVVEIQEDPSGDRYPKVVILDYFENSHIDLEKTNHLKVRFLQNEPIDIFQQSGYFYVSQSGKRDCEPWDRLHFLGKNSNIDLSLKGVVPLIWWKNFDDFLIDLFSIL
jgi:hypothetical protein